MSNPYYKNKYPVRGIDGYWRDAKRRIFDPEIMKMGADGIPEVTHGGFFKLIPISESEPMTGNQDALVHEAIEDETEELEDANQESKEPKKKGKNWALWGLGIGASVFLCVISAGRIRVK